MILPGDNNLEKASKKNIPFIKWQKPMLKVLYALIPVVVASIYFFGWRSLCLLILVNAAGFLCEYAFARYYKEPVSSSIFVTNVLFTLILPPNLPYWMAIIGIVFGVVFGKMVFGGFGKNIFNPAMVGRAFIYINFANPMTGKWFSPFSFFPAGFMHYTTDSVCSATPMKVMKAGGEIPLSSLFFGNTGGCLGETCAILIILGGIYLVWTKTANKNIVISCFASTLLLQGIFWLCDLQGAFDPLRAILSGGFMLGVFFMATDPVSACQTNPGRWIYGALIGSLTIIIRQFSVWAEGFMFAILLANMFGPIIDYTIREMTKKRKNTT